MAGTGSWIGKLCDMWTTEWVGHWDMFFPWNGCYLVTGRLAMICNDGMMECSPGCVLHVFFYCDRYICVNINIYICLLCMENDWADDLKSCNYMVMIYRMIYRSTNLSIDLSIYLPKNIVYSSLV